MTKCFLKIFASSLAFLLFFGCISIVEKTGQFMDGSLFDEKITAVYESILKDDNNPVMKISITENKNAEKSIVISLPKYAMIKIRGSLTDDSGAFLLASLEYLAGSAQGWNEYSLEISGDGIFAFNMDEPYIEIAELEHLQITKGRIHRYDSRIIGIEALAALRNRKERVAAAVNWMLSYKAPVFADIKEFSKYWEPVFFPEIVSAKKRPSGWLQEGDERKKADSIMWNHGYTERVFPEDLQPIRNSGTLLRDWEEALSWIFMEYEWENITAILSDKTILNKIK